MRFKEFTDIDSLRHAKVDEKPVKNFTGNYKSLSISEPPTNTSKATQEELKKLKELMSNRTSDIEASVKNHDKDVAYSVKQYLKDKGLEYSDSDINKIVGVGSAIVRYYKNKFQRPRPYNLAEAMDMDFDNIPLESDTMKTPAYPAGHSLQSRLIAEYYIDKYPSHKEGLLEAAEECGKGRLYAGWHYPSDHEASVKLAKQIYPDMNLRESFAEHLLESIIDIPRRTYAPGVFDEADTKDPKIKPSVKQLIDNQIKDFESEYPVLKVSLIGSILTKRYRNDADLDFNVLFDVPEEKQEAERLRLSKKYLSSKNPNNIQGKEIPGTKHPINYYFITDQETYEDQNKKADAVFDIENNSFIKRPDDFVFDPSMYVKEFDRKVQALDVVKGELKRDIIDYKELKELTPDDVLNLQEKIKDKLDEIEDSLEAIIKIGDGVDTERRAAFDTDMSPDEIRQYGIKNRLPKNVIYKMLEKYHYLKFYKYCKKILEDGIVTDKEIDDLEIHENMWMENVTEARDKSIAFTFGRFNPPTIGHEKLINKVKSIPANDYRIYLSRSQDSKKNPLDPRKKLGFMKSMFRKYASKIELNPTNMVLDLATTLHNKGFTDITMVVGSDRVREFENILKKYNGERNRHGFYNFKSIKVASAGERDPDADGATGMSASKMRAAAEKGDIDSFKKGLPRGISNKEIEDLFVSVRSGMGLSKKLAASFGGMSAVGTGAKPVASLEGFEQKQIRDLYIREMIFNINDKINYVKEDIQGIVKRRGTNYIVLEDNNNNLHKAWIWDCIPVPADREVDVREYDTNVDYGFKAVDKIEEDLDAQPQDKDVKKKDGTQPKKYYKDLSKDTKSKRADFFKKNKDNKEAPGDKDAKTKPSIHTKKFKQMYGENTMDEACWTGYKQVGFKKKGGKQVPNCVPESMTIEDAKRVEGYVPESYEIGADYANHTKDVTPGEKPAEKPVDAKERGKPEQKITKEDIEKWQATDETIDKYKKRYAEEWTSKLQEVVKRMMEKL